MGSLQLIVTVSHFSSIISMVTTGYYPLLLVKYSHKLTPSFTHQLAQIYRKYLDSQEDTGCETLLSLRIPRVSSSQVEVIAVYLPLLLLYIFSGVITLKTLILIKRRCGLTQIVVFGGKKCFLFLRYPLRDVVSVGDQSCHTHTGQPVLTC